MDEEITIEIKIKRSDIEITDKRPSIYESQKGLNIPQVISHRDYPKDTVIKKKLNNAEWTNLKNILEKNKPNYINRCIWILEQIK
tara:strand:- start:370 stop:624 length:255 start_codon:yes stop_codon:yes gene_type:complete